MTHCPDGYLNCTDLARYLSVPTTSLSRWTQQGIGPPRRYGNSPCYSIPVVETWLSRLGAKVAEPNARLTPLLTPARVAEVLEVERTVVDAWRAFGWGPPFLMLTARTPRYVPHDVDRWARETPPAENLRWPGYTPDPYPEESRVRRL